MSLIWFGLGLAIGAVLGAKFQTITLFFYEHGKPFLIKLKNIVLKKINAWFNKQ